MRHSLPLSLFQVHVEFNSGLDKIILEGPPEQVQLAKESFETFTEDLVGHYIIASIDSDSPLHHQLYEGAISFPPPDGHYGLC